MNKRFKALAVLGLLAACAPVTGVMAQRTAPVDKAVDTKAPVKPAEGMANGIMVIGAWARATPGGARIGAAFLEITANPGTEDKLISASTPIAQSVELHDHIRDGGVVKMRRIEAIPIQAGKAVTLKPGGLHLMLMDLKDALKEGDEFDIILTFEKAGAIKVKAPVQKLGAMTGPPADQGSGPGHDHPGSASGTK